MDRSRNAAAFSFQKPVKTLSRGQLVIKGDVLLSVLLCGCEGRKGTITVWFIIVSKLLKE